MQPSRVRGVRAAIYFQPQILSMERICAGIVLRQDNGDVSTLVGVKFDEVTHAFGDSGYAIYTIAHHLTSSLAGHVTRGGNFEDWASPFESASIDKLGRIEGGDLDALLSSQLQQNSTLYRLLDDYEIPILKQADGIVRQVRRVLQHSKSDHLVQRFHRELPVKPEALPLRVEFLGAHYACYFLKIAPTRRGLEESARRAHGKLFELQSVQSHFNQDSAFSALDERPDRFELIVVGDKSDPIQRSAWLQIESLANDSKLLTNIVSSPEEAAGKVRKHELAA